MNPWRGFMSLVLLTLRRQWRVRAMGFATLALIGLMTLVVALISSGRTGWGFANRWSGRAQMQNKYYPPRVLDPVQMTPQPFGAMAIESAVFGAFRGQLADPRYEADFALTNYARWVVFAIHLGFLLPLVNLAFASQAIGGEREGRTMIWLLTRPLPRPAIYVAKWLGVLPWCMAISLVTLAALGWAGGPVGRDAAWAFAPAVALGSIAYASVFHLLGAIVRRPAVMGLAYLFFFETLVANLPGSLKFLSLNYYVKSLLYDVVNARVVSLTPEALDVYAPCDAATATASLVGTAIAVTAIGAVWFSRAEPGEEI